MRRIYLGVFFLALTCFRLKPCAAQSHEAYWGPPVQVFDRDIHPGDEAFWAVTQDANGAIIAGNSWGPIKFTGLRWELIPMPPPAFQPVFSFAVVPDGKVYFAALQDFGYLKDDQFGQSEYVSLKDQVPLSVGSQWSPKSVHSIADKAFYTTNEGLIFVNGDSISTWEAPFKIQNSFVVDQTIALVTDQNSVCFLDGAVCKSLDILGLLSNQISFIAPIQKGNVLIGTRLGEFFQLTSDGQLLSWHTQADSYFKEHELASAIIMKDGSVFSWTYRKGGVWLDQNGGILGILDDDHTDLPNTAINGALEDQDGDLWLATSGGLIHVTLRSQVSVLPRFGPDDLDIVGAAIGGDKVILGSNHGVWSGPRQPGPRPAFSNLGGDVGRVFRLGGANGNAFLFSEGHLFALTENKFKETGATGGRDVIPHFSDSTKIVVGSDTGITVVSKNNETGIWSAEQSHDFGYNVMDLAWDVDSTLWTTVEPGGVLHVKFDHSLDSVQHVSHFSQVADYPMDISQVESVWGKILFISDEGIVTPDPENKGQFIPETISGRPWIPPSGTASMMISDGRNRLATRFPNGIGIADAQVWYPRLLPESTEHSPRVIDASSDRLKLWGWGKKRLHLYDLSKTDDYPASWQVQIRSVWAPDSIGFNLGDPRSVGIIQRGVESVRFEITAPRFRNVKETKFRYRLVGLQSNWSSFQSDPIISFSVLKPNTYTLEVQGVDGQGVLSQITQWSFRVRSPWYRTTAAVSIWIILLVLAAGLAIFAFFRRRVRFLEQTHAKLESLVEERTEEIRRQTILLKELDDSRSRFFANVSHEFRTPLTLITAPIQEALDGNYGDLPIDAQHRFERAQLNSDRLLRLVNQLLDLARLESGQLKAEMELVDVSTFCRRITSMFEHAASSRGITLTQSIPSEPVWICLDFEQMEKVIVNLLSNALKFTPEGGLVRIRVFEEGGGCCIEVNDSGIGIPPNLINRVFDRFFQVDDASTRSSEGLGIGLAMSKELVQLHGGTLEVTSKLDQGSTFTCWLPKGFCYDEEIEPADVSFQSNPVVIYDRINASGSDINSSLSSKEETPIVLVVEDNADMRSYIAELFSSTYQVLEADNGKSGMEVALKFIPDIIVSDLMMPNVDGIEFCRAMRADPRTCHIPFIMLTAKVDPDTRLESLDTGADLYLGKPFDPKELRLHLENLVRTRKAIQEFLKRGSTSDSSSEIMSLSTPDQELFNHIKSLSQDAIFDSGFGVDQFADRMHMSRRQLLRKMKALFGETPKEYIQRLRFEKACRMLERGESVDFTSTAVGYSDRPSFTRAFVEMFGIAPSKWGK